jgi:hypothetical protein
MKSDIIHLRFNLADAMHSRKEMLESEVTLIDVHQHLKNYADLRKKELKLKEKLKRKLISVEKEIKKIKSVLPSARIPEKGKIKGKEMRMEEKIRKIPEEVRQKVKIKSEQEKRYASELEKQLSEIRSKLQKLQ